MLETQQTWSVYPLTKPLQVRYACTNGLTWADYESPQERPSVR